MVKILKPNGELEQVVQKMTMKIREKPDYIVQQREDNPDKFIIIDAATGKEVVNEDPNIITAPPVIKQVESDNIDMSDITEEELKILKQTLQNNPGEANENSM